MKKDNCGKNYKQTYKFIKIYKISTKLRDVAKNANIAYLWNINFNSGSFNYFMSSINFSMMARKLFLCIAI
jgi:hypothetical protein